MSIQRTLRLPALLRPTITQPAFVQHRFASSTPEKPGQSVEGASDKSEKKAQPKLNSASPPSDADAPQDVKDHNADMAKRAERPSERVKDEDVEKDKVNKGFWSGEGQKNVGGVTGH